MRSLAAAIVDMVRNGRVEKLDIGNNKLGLPIYAKVDSLVKDSAIEVWMEWKPTTDEGAKVRSNDEKESSFQAVGVAECGLSGRGSIADAC